MSDNSFAGINFQDPESKNIFETMSIKMCPDYKTKNESMFISNLKLKKNDDYTFFVNGNINDHNGNSLFIKYSAPNSPTYSTSFSGSGLPYPNEDIAFENTPNRGVVKVINGKFEILLKYPNSYYINMGTIYVPPHVKLALYNDNNTQIGNIKDVFLGEGIPFRTLTWPEQRKWSDGPLFYINNNLRVRNQNQILLDSAYPCVNKVPDNFWGLTPPH